MSAKPAGSVGSTPAAALTASGNLAGWAVASVTIGTPGLAKRPATASPTAVCGSARKPVSRYVAAMASATSLSSARPAAKSPRIAASGPAAMANEPALARSPIRARTTPPSRSYASNSSRSKFDDTWMSIDGEVGGG